MSELPGCRDLLERWLDQYGGSTCADGTEQADMDKLDFDTRAWLSFGPYPAEATLSEKRLPQDAEEPGAFDAALAMTRQAVADTVGGAPPMRRKPLEHWRAFSQRLKLRVVELERELAEAKIERDRVVNTHEGLMRASEQRAESAVAAAVAQERDAERYRWLRDCEFCETAVDLFYMGDDGSWSGTHALKQKESLDAAIDAAIRAAKEGGNG
jgi:hypothetical protein